MAITIEQLLNLPDVRVLNSEDNQQEIGSLGIAVVIVCISWLLLAAHTISGARPEVFHGDSQRTLVLNLGLASLGRRRKMQPGRTIICFHASRLTRRVEHRKWKT